MSKNQKISEALVLAGLIGFAYYKYSKMSQSEKQKVHEDIKEIGEKVIKELIPEGIKGFIPNSLFN